LPNTTTVTLIELLLVLGLLSNNTAPTLRARDRSLTAILLPLTILFPLFRILAGFAAAVEETTPRKVVVLPWIPQTGKAGSNPLGPAAKMVIMEDNQLVDK
jgi:hypothetical protein